MQNLQICCLRISFEGSSRQIKMVSRTKRHSAGENKNDFIKIIRINHIFFHFISLVGIILSQLHSYFIEWITTYW